jgi:hypothetical protein
VGLAGDGLADGWMTGLKAAVRLTCCQLVTTRMDGPGRRAVGQEGKRGETDNGITSVQYNGGDKQRSSRGEMDQP